MSSVMRYRGNRNGVQLGEYTMRKGELIPVDVIEKIPSGRFGSLLRTALIIPVQNAEELASMPEGKVGELCPECGEGPFKRLEQHISLKHTDPDEGEGGAEVPAPVHTGPGSGGLGHATGSLDVE